MPKSHNSCSKSLQHEQCKLKQLMRFKTTMNRTKQNKMLREHPPHLRSRMPFFDVYMQMSRVQRVLCEEKTFLMFPFGTFIILYFYSKSNSLKKSYFCLRVLYFLPEVFCEKSDLMFPSEPAVFPPGTRLKRETFLIWWQIEGKRGFSRSKWKS